MMQRADEFPTNIRAVLFDLDDTLYPEDAFLNEVFSKVCDIVWTKLEVPREETLRRLWQLRQTQSKEIFTRLLQGLQCDNTTPKQNLVSEFVNCYREATVEKIMPYPDVLPCLRWLKLHDIKTGIVTNGYPPLQERKLQRLGIRPFIDVVVFANMYRPKPAPEGFLRAAEMLSLDPKSCLFIGDRLDVDVLGALGVGMYSALLERNRRCLYDDCYGVEIRGTHNLTYESGYIGSITSLECLTYCVFRLIKAETRND
ncbi:MAG TPA: HAD family hydrolase [Clostridia bacterium]|nr:HAD family hydrolase [Clostridia bacterium]